MHHIKSSRNRKSVACRACLKQKFPQLPTAAQEGFTGYLWHRQERFTFDDTVANLEAATFAPAFRDWHEEGIAAREEVRRRLVRAALPVSRENL